MTKPTTLTIELKEPDLCHKLVKRHPELKDWLLFGEYLVIEVDVETLAFRLVPHPESQRACSYEVVEAVAKTPPAHDRHGLRVDQLIEFLRCVPPKSPVVVPAPDHSYARVCTAASVLAEIVIPGGELAEYHDDASKSFVDDPLIDVVLLHQ